MGFPPIAGVLWSIGWCSAQRGECEEQEEAEEEEQEEEEEKEEETWGNQL